MTGSMLASVVKDHQGCVIGDDHDNPDITKHITEHMASLAEAGVKVLFVEMFQDTKEHQEWLSTFNDDAHGTLEHSNMRRLLEHDWKYSPRTGADYMRMFKAARENGISIVGVDPPQRDTIRPIKSANSHWERCVRDYMRKHPDHKYVVFGGKLHTQEENQLTEECEQATGIDTLLGIPVLTFSRFVYTREANPRLLKLSDTHYKIMLPDTVQKPDPALLHYINR